MEKLIKINLGCGRNIENKFPEPWINVDLSGDCADYYCDIKKLPKEWSDKFDEVRASHVLEHFFMDEFDFILTEWLRILKPGGTLRIIVPDFDIIIQALVSGSDSKNRNALSVDETTPVLSQIFGVGYESRITNPEWRHRFVFNKELLNNLLERQPSIGTISFYEKENDPAALLGIKDDSQNPFSLCASAIKVSNGSNNY
ncbi:MAG: methyltransferase domain-containing protein [Candidatus Woesearchaeota archaeon]|jgi:SAM-dependent methyltransferase